ncbi:shugoshin-1-like isoform X2 [Phragmites australis]|uniref:shugoshin-1-like isoform X2 n=1 Tax=Phragmites australis TaxID=29695 RepID=UPI002D79E52B|nr:shugoshin-1-like isoform X2 [Phragmites australis]
MAGASGGAALGGPHPNPKGDGPRLQSLEGKGKPVPLADITNTGRPNPTRSISVADVVKENAKLHHLLSERTKIIEVSRVEMQKLRLALQASRQQNLQLAQTNSQMLAELNLGKDRLKVLQHELSCTAAVLKVKDSELECKNKTAHQRRKKVNSQEVMKAIPSKVAAVEAHQIDGSVTSTVEHHLVEAQSAVPSNTDCQEAPQDTTKKRGRNKRKSESSECVKDTNITRDHYKPHLQPIMSLDHEDARKPLRRRSSRLNSESCEVTEVSRKTSHEDAVAFETELRIFQKQHGPTTGKDTESLQNECSAIVHEVVVASEFKKIEINEQPRKEASLKEIQEACSRIPGVEAHQFGDKANNTKQSHLAETQSYLPFNIIEAPKPPEDTVSKRGANKQKWELCESGKDSTIEDITAKCDSSTSDPLHHEEKRKSQRRRSLRLNSVSSEDTKSTFETLHEDVIAPLPSSSSNALMEQRTNQQSDSCSSMKSTEGQVAGRRSLRRAAEKVVSYKEIPLNVKMRRP